MSTERGKSCLLLLLLLLGLAVTLVDADPSSCKHRDFGFGSTVCVCNSLHCDWLPRPSRPPADHALTFTSSKAGLRFLKDEVFFQEGSGSAKNDQHLTINRSASYQTVIGFGGAFTDAAGINILALPEAAQENLLKSYFSELGLEYSVARVPIGGCDFSARIYTYDDDSHSANLSGFKMQKEDFMYKIPLMHRAKALVPDDAPELLFKAAAWSAPTWMKTNQHIYGFGFLKEEYYQAWAEYHIKFLDAYADQGLRMWAISTGNEPLNGVVPLARFNSMGWTPASHRDWIAKHLGPTLRGSRHNGSLILALDDQRILLPWWIDWILQDKTANKYVDGVAIHWYLNVFAAPPSVLDKVHERHPDKVLISSEACNVGRLPSGYRPWDRAVELGSWERGENYLRDIITGMNHWLTGWMDWNLALNAGGGPNWAGNFVDSPIIVNSTSGEFYKNPTFYAMGHISKFVPRGSVRVHVVSKGGTSLFSSGVQHVAFLRPDGAIAVVLLNEHTNARNMVIAEEGRHIAIEVPAKSFCTVLYW